MKSNILTLVFWGLFYLFDGGKSLIYVFVSASFHESAHMFFYYVFRAKIKAVKVLPFGISAEFYSTSRLSYTKENIALFAGPFFNLLIACLSFFISRKAQIFESDVFIAYNLAYFILNMLPVLPLDGGRILKNLLLKRFLYKKATSVSRVFSAIFIFLLFASAVVFRNFSLLLIVGYLAFSFFSAGE